MTEVNEETESATESNGLRVGVLALQGDFREHVTALRALGATVTEVRRPQDLDGLSGLVIPGGESTAIERLMRLYELDTAIEDFAGAILGTCAGLIVVSHLELADVEVERNAYGRQNQSFETELDLGDGLPLRGVFIRAPRVSRYGDKVQVLARYGDDPVLLLEGSVLLATFHPELTDDPRVHRLFLELAETWQEPALAGAVARED
jgi:5'-phosphate synthase pdxT subunit